MRYPKDHKDQVRERILHTAAQRFRAEGIDTVGVARLMQAVGLTHGGFYAHFPSKDALVSEAAAASFDDTLPRLRAQVEHGPAEDKLGQLWNAYLSTLHRDHPENGCFAAALAGEIARQPEAIRSAVEGKLREFLSMIDAIAAQDGKAVPAGAVLALMVGAVALSRIPTDRSLSERILSQALAALPRLTQPASTPAAGTRTPRRSTRR